MGKSKTLSRPQCTERELILYVFNSCLNILINGRYYWCYDQMVKIDLGHTDRKETDFHTKKWCLFLYQNWHEKLAFLICILHLLINQRFRLERHHILNFFESADTQKNPMVRLTAVKSKFYKIETQHNRRNIYFYKLIRIYFQPIRIRGK